MTRSRRRFDCRARFAAGVVLAAAWLGTSTPASAQLSTRHYLPPLLGYANSQIEIEISTPSPTPVTYRVYSRSGGLISNSMSIDAIEGTVVVGAPVQHTFERDGNDLNASGAVGHLLGSSPSPQDDYGIVVEASVAVTVTVYQLLSYNRDIVPSKGNNAIGREFYLWSNVNGTGNAVTAANDAAHFFSLMALEDDTTVQITSDAVFAGFTPGAPVVLDALQTFTVRTTTNATITGSHVIADKPITVLSGDVHPPQQGRPESDGASDQIVPVTLAGTQYVVGNIADSLAYGVLGADGVGVGNRYVQIVGLVDGTEISHYRSDTGVNQTLSIDRGESAAVHLGGDQGTGHFFRSINAPSGQPFLLFLNTSGEPAGEMGGAALPGLRGPHSKGTFCSGTRFVELTSPNATQAFMVYVPTAHLSSLRVDAGSGFVPYDDAGLPPATVTAVDPDGPGEIESISFVRFPGNLVSFGQRVAFSSTSRMHVAIGTAIASSTSSFGYFSDYHIGFLLQDPVLHIPTDQYIEPLSFADSRPRAIRHCLEVDSVCSDFYDITRITSNRGGTFSQVTTNSTVAGANPCFDFTPVPVPGAGPQEYVVNVTVTDENGDSRDVAVLFTFSWADDDGDGLPDGLDLDDDNDGIPDAVELGGADLSGDQDLDGIPDYVDTSFVTCDSTDGERCDAIPARFDVDGDGIPNHLDLDSDGDGVWDLIEGNDANQDGRNDAQVIDADGDGQIDAPVDTNHNGLDDAYEASLGGRPAALGDTDGDGTPDYLDDDDDGDGVLTRYEDLNGNGDFSDDDTDRDGVPNYLDDDDDGDGVLTQYEGADPNGDGDPSDAVITGSGSVPDYLNPAIRPPDSDGDGIPDAIERPGGQDRDTDGDGIPDHLDPDDDGDGIPTRDERPGGRDRDTDGDGIPDHLDPDDDGDTIPTIDERPGGRDRDTDGDGIPDHLDPDDDNDGILTKDEPGDADGNGVPDYLEVHDGGGSGGASGSGGATGSGGTSGSGGSGGSGGTSGSGGSGGADGSGGEAPDRGAASLAGGGFGCSVSSGSGDPAFVGLFGALLGYGLLARRRRAERPG